MDLMHDDDGEVVAMRETYRGRAPSIVEHLPMVPVAGIIVGTRMHYQTGHPLIVVGITDPNGLPMPVLLALDLTAARVLRDELTEHIDRNEGSDIDTT